MRKVYLLLILLISSYVLNAQTVTTCSGVNIAYSDATSYPTATGYTWSIVSTTGGVTGATSSNGSAVNQTLSTTALTGGTATYSVTENGLGTNFTLTVIVYPVVTMNHVADLAVCYGAITAVTFSSALSNTTYTWIKDPTAIGIAGGLTGAGNITSFTANTNLTVPTTSVFAVTPFSNACAGSATSFSITVFPLPTVTPISGQAVCNGFSITATTFTGQLSNTTFQWTTTNVSIAGGALGSTFSGTGNISGFTGLNVSGVPLTALIVVTPMSNSCSGTSTSFSLTVNPTPTVNPVSNIVICNNTLLTGVAFSGGVSNTTYNWTNNNTGIGLSAGAAGNIAAFTVTNASTAAVTALVTVTPLSNACTGASTSFTIVVNPTPVMSSVAAQVLCAGTLTTAINFASSIPSSTYNWTSNINSIGLPFSGNGNITSFTSINSSGAPLTALISVSGVTNTCIGAAYTFSITVNPIPTVNSISNQVFCDNTTITGVIFSSPNIATSTFSWSSNTTAIGLALSGSTTVNGFTATNSSSIPVTALITVTATSNTCTGPSVNFQITVNPTPVINTVLDQNICAGTLTSAVTFGSTIPTATYNWTNTAVSIGIGFTGTGNISSFTGLNGSNAPVTALIAVTPVSNTCSGASYTFSITVNPTPLVNTVTPQITCNNTFVSAVTFTGSVAGAQYNWSSNSTAIGIASSGSTTVNGFTGTNGGSNAPATAIVTVTAISNTCSGLSMTFSYTINPTPTIATVPDQLFCNGVSTTAVIFSGTVTGTTFNWSNNNTAIGLASTGIGNIGSYSTTNTGNTAIGAFVTITPTANSCIGTATSYSIIINPTPGVSGYSNQSLCAGTLTTQIIFSSLVANTHFDWTNTTTSIGLAASSSGTINAFTGTNTTGIPVAGNITVTPVSNTCAGTPVNFVIVVNPVPVLNFPSGTQVVCNGTLTTPITFGLSTTITNTTFTWSSNNGSIGIGTGPLSGNIAAFTGTNISTVPVTADFTVTALSNACSSTAVQFSITVNPTPTVTGLSNQAICAGTLTAGVTFGGNLTGSIFNWTNSLTSIGLAGAGSGTINAFTGTNSTSVPVYATITVTPLSNTCNGIAQNFSIIVNPVPVLNTVSSQVICNGLSSTTVIFTSPAPITNTVFTWTNSAPGIGLSAGSTGNIAAFTATNLSNVPVLASISVVGSSNTCNSVAQQFTFTINPTPTVNTVSNIVLCDGILTSAVIFTGNLSNTTFNWTNTATSIGIAGASSGTINAFTVTNNTNLPVNASITVTPFSNTCTGTAMNFSIVVNPVPVLNTVSSQVICNGLSSTVVTFTSPAPITNTVFTWTNSDPSIGLSAGSTGNIAAFTATNVSNVPVLASISVVGSSNTCNSVAQQFTFTINPTPTVNTITNQVLCAGVLTTAVVFTGNLSNTTYNWTNTATSIGIAGASSGTINAFTVTNNTSLPVHASITVTPFSNTCTGTAMNFSIVVNPVPVLNTVSSQVICNGLSSTVVTFTSPAPITNTIFTWTNSDPSIGLSAGATGNIAAFTATNASNVPVLATLSVVGSSNTCNSVAQQFTFTINPTPTVNTIGNQVLCAGLLTTAVVFTGNLSNTTFNWTNTATSIGIAGASSGTINAFTVTNNTGLPVNASITVTPFSNTCTGTAINFSIVVNPVPVVNLPSNQAICNGILSLPVNFSGSTITNTVYTWTNNTTSIGLAAGATGDITAFTATNVSNVPILATLTVTASSNTCNSVTQQFTITVNPTPTVVPVSAQIVCLSISTTAVIFSGNLTSTTFNWTNTTTLVGLGTLTGTGNIGGFVTTNGGSSVPISALIVVTPFSNNCTGTATSFTITVNPTPTVTQIADQFICNTLSSSPVVFTGLVPNTTYQWTQTNPGVGLASLSSTGNIAAFSGTNAGAVPINSVLTVTPISNTCSGTAIVFSYVINPTPTVNAVADQTLCNGVTTTAVTFTGGLTNTTYSWLQTNATVGLTAISGTGNIAAFASTNALGVPIHSVITVTPLSNACTGNFTTFSIVVNPTPTVAGYADQVKCNTNLTTAVVFTGAVTGTIYQWTQTNPAAGLTGLSGTGNIPVFSATNPNPVPINTVISVTPLSNACTGTLVSFSIVVNPTPTVAFVNDIVTCTGVLTSLTFTGFLTNTTYSWVQTNNAVGLLPFSSTGNTIAFTSTNVQSVPINTVITVTPSSNTCIGATTTFSIVVNPRPTVVGVADQFICNGVISNAVVFSGNVANTSYQWVHTNLAVGLVPISGTGTIAAFTATAPGNVPLGSLVTVTPMSNACTGTAIQFSLIANPTPNVTGVANQVFCNGVLTTAITFTGSLTNTTYKWAQTNNAIGLTPFSGTGTIVAFTTTNTLAVPIQSVVAVTPLSNTCQGAIISFTYVINPTPTINAIADQIYCNTNVTSAVVFSGFVSNTSYQWTNTNVGVGLLALSGTTVSIPSFTATNATGVPINSQVTVTPMSISCVGTALTFSYVVNPTPTVVAVTSQVLCNGFTTTAVVFTGAVTNTTYSWVSTSIITGLTPLTGTGNIAAFTAKNTNTVPINSSVTVTPLSNTCTGATNTFTFIVNPTPTVTAVTSQSICNGFTVSAVNFTGVIANTSFTWTNSNSGVGLASLSGSGNIAAFIGTNAGTAPISAQLTVSPMSNSCTGTSASFTITINPTPQLTSPLTPAPICSGTLFSYSATSATVGITYSWNRGSLAAINGNVTGSGTGIVSEILTSSSASAVNVGYTYTLNANSCSNIQTVTLIVNPTAQLNSTLVPTAICSSTLFSYTASSNSASATFAWTRILPAGLSSGGAAAGTGDINQTITNSTTAPVTASYAYVVSASGCTNPQAFTVTFNVNPIPVLSSTTTPLDICSGVAFSYAATSATVGTSFAWSRTAVTGISTVNGSTGTGNSIFNVLNNSNTTSTAQPYNIVMTANNCVNNQSVTVNVSPVPVLNTSLTPAAVCSNVIFNYAPASATATIFTWTRPFTTGITNASSSGSGDPAEILVSTSPLPVNVIYTYSVITAAGCSNAQTVTATVNPLPTLTSSLTPAAVCSGAVFNYPPTSATPGTVFNWRRPAVTGIPNGAATGFNNPSEILSNPSVSPIAVIYNFTLTANSCVNTQPVTVFVNPVPIVNPQTASICSNSIFTVTPTNVPTATLYTWATPVTTPVGSTLGANAQATGVTPISQFLNNQTTSATTVVYSVLPTASGCSGSTFTITVNVNPTPVVGSQTMTATCSGTPFIFVSGGVPAGTTYTWAAPGLIPANSLTGGSAQPLSQPSVSQTLNSTNNVMDSAVYSVTPATVLCVGSPFLLTVPIKPLPLISNTRDTICSGNAFTLNPSPVPANTTYTWTTPVISPFGAIAGGAAQSVPTTGISQTLTNNTTAYAQAAYTVTPSAQGCAGPTFLLIETVNRSIPTFAAQSALVCSGTAFNANPANAPAGTLYTWPVPANPPPAGITGSSAVSVPVANVSQVLSNLNNSIDTAIYTVTPLVNNCPGIAFLATIRVMPLPKATISGPSSVCANTIVDTVSLAFNGTAPWSFTYSDGITTNTKTGITSSPYKLTMPPIAKNLTRRTITVINVKDASCSNTFDTSFFTQTINALPVGKVISLHGNYLCNGIKDTLFIQSADSLGYQWQLNGTNIAGAITDSIATTTGAGSYNALLTNKFGCIDTAAVPVNLILVKPPVLKMSIDTTCINSITTFTNKTDTTFTGAIQWQWTFGNGLTASTMNATTTYTSAGNYHAILKATQLSCSGYPPVTLDSTVNIKFPIPALAGSTVSALKGDLTPVAGRSIPGYKYQWVPSAGIQNPDSPSTLFNFGATQQYVIKLISPEGCITNDSLLVRVFDANTQQIFVPKSFTPNGDGVNDIMYPYIAGIKQFHYFRVLNRFGKLLFETKTENAGWNGMLNGTPQPMGIYFWFAEGIGADGTVVQKSGQLLLIR